MSKKAESVSVTCPACNGTGSYDDTAGRHPCATCCGCGVVWRPLVPGVLPAEPGMSREAAMKALGDGLDEYMRCVFGGQRAPVEKALDVTSSKDFPAKCSDVAVFGNPDLWRLVCKASSKSQGWMKSTKALEVPGLGVLVQVSTQQGDHVAEALCFVGGATVVEDPKTGVLSFRQTELIARCMAGVTGLLDAHDERTAKEKKAAKKGTKKVTKKR